MRIIILTHDKDRHFYFCNQVIRNTNNVVGVFTGGKNIYNNLNKKKKFFKILKKKKFINYLKNKLLNIYFRNYGNEFIKEKDEAEYLFFNGSKKKFLKQYSNLLITSVKPEYSNINNPYYVSLIRELKPDIILVMGTCLIGKEIINSAKHVINLHTGLSPYFRGGYSNLWPIVKKKYNMFGVTVHELSEGIDSGNIFFSCQPELNENDNYGTINCKCIQLGAKKVIESIGYIEKNSLNSIEQWMKGNLFFNSDWNNYIAYKYFKNKKHVIFKSIENIENNSQSEIYLVNNGKKIDV